MKTERPKPVAMTIRITPELRDELKQVARVEERSLNFIMNAALRDWLASQ